MNQVAKYLKSRNGGGVVWSDDVWLEQRTKLGMYCSAWPTSFSLSTDEFKEIMLLRDFFESIIAGEELIYTKTTDSYLLTPKSIVSVVLDEDMKLSKSVQISKLLKYVRPSGIYREGGIQSKYPGRLHFDKENISIAKNTLKLAMQYTV